MTLATQTEPEVLIRVEGQVGRITLNRPQALNALTTNICREMTRALTAWRDDPAIALVMIDHAGERGFCAGGDIRTLAASGKRGGAVAREFFLTEYELNLLLFRFPKATVAFIDGVVMGGGVGISLPCRYRVGTERTTFAMPETGIGLFPDVGATWFLPRMPDHIGTWIALTGARLKAADCKFVGVLSHYLESSRLGEVKRAIIRSPDGIERVLGAAEASPGTPPLSERRLFIAESFGRASVEGVLRALEAGDGWAREQARIIRTKSPTSLKIALRQMAEGVRLRSFAEALSLEYRLAQRIVVSHDFLEGVRAVILDKDNAPCWKPACIEDVSEADIDAAFAPPHIVSPRLRSRS